MENIFSETRYYNSKRKNFLREVQTEELRTPTEKKCKCEKRRKNAHSKSEIDT